MISTFVLMFLPNIGKSAHTKSMRSRLHLGLNPSFAIVAASSAANLSAAVALTAKAIDRTITAAKWATTAFEEMAEDIPSLDRNRSLALARRCHRMPLGRIAQNQRQHRKDRRRLKAAGAKHAFPH